MVNLLRSNRRRTSICNSRSPPKFWELWNLDVAHIKLSSSPQPHTYLYPLPRKPVCLICRRKITWYGIFRSKIPFHEIDPLECQLECQDEAEDGGKNQRLSPKYCAPVCTRCIDRDEMWYDFFQYDESEGCYVYLVKFCKTWRKLTGLENYEIVSKQYITELRTTKFDHVVRSSKK